MTDDMLPKDPESAGPATPAGVPGVPPGRPSTQVAASVTPPGGPGRPAGVPGTWGGGSATPAGPNENADYYAPTQTHLAPVPSRPGAGASATPPGAGATPGWSPGTWPPQTGPMGGAMPPVGGPMGPMGPVGPAHGHRRRNGNRGKVSLIAGGVVVIAASTGIALAASSSSSTKSTAAPAPTHKPLPIQLAIPSVKATPAAASKSPVAVTTSPAAVRTTAAPAGPAVDGVWTGTYTCNQGLTGMRMAITGSSDDSLRATIDFYPVASNPGVPSGSYVMTGDYSSSGGLVLTPDHWIDQPPRYNMVGFSSPGPNGSSMQGTVHFDGCSTFSVSK